MKESNLLYAIGRYCKEENFQITLKALDRRTDEKTQIEKPAERTVVEIFEKYFQPKKKQEGLSFSFNLTNKRSQLRKRLQDNECNKPDEIKRMNIMKARKNDIPDTFLTLLDELGLDKNKAKLFYENKDQWTYVKSDKLIYCANRGNFL